MGFWAWFKSSQTPSPPTKKRSRSDDYMFIAPSPWVGMGDPAGGVIVLGANAIGGITHAVGGIARRRKQRNLREARKKLPVSRVRTRR